MSEPDMLTDEEIEFVEALAHEQGDEVLVRLCQQAMAGEEWARKECTYVITGIETSD